MIEFLLKLISKPAYAKGSSGSAKEGAAVVKSNLTPLNNEEFSKAIQENYSGKALMPNDLEKIGTLRERNIIAKENRWKEGLSNKTITQNSYDKAMLRIEKERTELKNYKETVDNMKSGKIFTVDKIENVIKHVFQGEVTPVKYYKKIANQTMLTGFYVDGR